MGPACAKPARTSSATIGAAPSRRVIICPSSARMRATHQLVVRLAPDCAETPVNCPERFIPAARPQRVDSGDKECAVAQDQHFHRWTSLKHLENAGGSMNLTLELNDNLAKFLGRSRGSLVVHHLSERIGGRQFQEPCTL